ncbi:MAG: hypothetical protein HC898_09545 [Phycisphaerales bacterium]|nr:hypothetical protein [Phycisphaerales bacterium]
MTETTKVWRCKNATVPNSGQHYSSNPSVMREHRSGDPAAIKYESIARFSEVVMVLMAHKKVLPMAQPSSRGA